MWSGEEEAVGGDSVTTRRPRRAHATVLRRAATWFRCASCGEPTDMLCVFHKEGKVCLKCCGKLVGEMEARGEVDVMTTATEHGMKRTYECVYEIKPRAGMTADEVKTAGLGACDAVVIHSILFTADGGRSEVIVSVDGKTGDPLPAIELWKSWVMMALHLSEATDLDDGKKSLCKDVFESIMSFVMGESRSNPIR